MVDRIGSYVIKDKLGEGAMGRVFRAYDPSLDLDVAIKVLTTEGDDSLLTRFKAEAGTTAKLRHKNVVRVYASGEYEGRPYLVMELLEGKTLHQVIREKVRLSLLEKVRIVYEAAQGLFYAHSNGVIHRDVKPGNIMLLPDGTVKIMDFGIARVADSDSARQTRTGFLIGTLPYMAPEQFAGADAHILADIFAFGVVCYELLAGVHPFQTEDWGVTVYRITNTEPTSLLELNSEIPEALSYAVRQALAKDRDIRYQSLQDFLLDTEPILMGLRQERARQIVDQARSLQSSGEFDQAMASVKNALELDPLSETGRQLREELRREIQRRALHSKIEGLLRNADQLVKQRRYADAVPLLENALRLDKSNATVRTRLEEVNHRMEGARKALRLCMEARRDLRQGDLSAALPKANEALEAESENEEARGLVEQIQAGIEQRTRAEIERQQQEKDRAAVQDAEALAAAGEFDQALALLDGIVPRPASRELVAVTRARVERERAAAEQRRRRDLDALLRSANDLCRKSLFDEARAASIAARKLAVPGEVQDLDQLDRAIQNRERATRLSSLLDLTRQLMADHSFADARAAIDTFGKAYPEEAALPDLLRKVAAAETAHLRSVDIENTLREANEKRGRGRYEEALAVVRRASERLSGEPLLMELEARLQDEFTNQRYEADRLEVLQEAHRRAEEGDPEAAVTLLRQHQARFLRDTVFLQAMAAAEEALASQRETQFVSEVLAGIEARSAQEDWTGALCDCEQALVRYPQRPELQQAAASLRARVGYESRLNGAAEALKGLINGQSWHEAQRRLAAMASQFPGEKRVAVLSDLLRDARGADLSAVSVAVRKSLANRRYAEASNALAKAQPRLGTEQAWLALERDLEERQAYERTLDEARKHERRGAWAEAERILSGAVMAGAPDSRAADLLDSVRGSRKQAEEAERARFRAEAEAREAARIEVERKRTEEAEHARVKAEADAREAARIEAERKKAEEIERARLKAEAEAREAARIEAERKRAKEAERARLKAEAEAREAARIEAERKRAEDAERARLKAEAAAREAARIETKRKAEAEAQEAARIEAERKKAEAAERKRREREERARKAREGATGVAGAPSPLYRHRTTLAAAAGVTLLAATYFLVHATGKRVIAVKPVPAELTFHFRAGSQVPEPQLIDYGDVPVPFDAVVGAPWLNVTPSTGERLTRLSVRVTPGSLAPSIYHSRIHFTWRSPSVSGPKSIPVHLIVDEDSKPAKDNPVSFAPTRLDFNFRIGDAMGSKAITVAGATANTIATSWEFPKGVQPWARVDHTRNTLIVSLQPAGLMAGSYQATLVVNPTGAAATRIPVALNIVPAFSISTKGPETQLRWSGTLAPGEVLSIQGRTCSTGELSAGELPQSRLEPVPGKLPAEFQIVALPTQSNGYTMKIKNAGAETQRRLTVTYRELQ